uniref:Uncharacterized protein n=1 Tax=Rhizophora mucronata TaxID=61149 RepID=A0A2P2P1M3_RHIMU
MMFLLLLRFLHCKNFVLIGWGFWVLPIPK